jgi:hypothetical protein
MLDRLRVDPPTAAMDSRCLPQLGQGNRGLKIGRSGMEALAMFNRRERAQRPAVERSEHQARPSRSIVLKPLPLPPVIELDERHKGTADDHSKQDTPRKGRQTESARNRKCDRCDRHRNEERSQVKLKRAARRWGQRETLGRPLVFGVMTGITIRSNRGSLFSAVRTGKSSHNVGRGLISDLDSLTVRQRISFGPKTHFRQSIPRITHRESRCTPREHCPSARRHSRRGKTPGRQYASRRHE